MFVQTEVTPNPNSLKFLPGKNVSNSGPYEITNKDEINNELVKNILSVNGVEGVFLGKDFISVNKSDQIKWDEIKHIVTSFINDFYSDGKEFVIDENIKEEVSNLSEIEEKIVKIGTNLEKNGVKIQTSEHVLSALVGLQIDNCIIELNSSEPPIMDGSSKEFVEGILKIGTKEQKAKEHGQIRP